MAITDSDAELFSIKSSPVYTKQENEMDISLEDNICETQVILWDLKSSKSSEVYSLCVERFECNRPSIVQITIDPVAYSSPNSEESFSRYYRTTIWHEKLIDVDRHPFTADSGGLSNLHSS